MIKFALKPTGAGIFERLLAPSAIGRRMRILIRCRQSGLYLAEFGSWVAEPERAFDFRSIAQAESTVRRDSLTGMEAILAYDRPVCELRVALGAW